MKNLVRISLILVLILNIYTIAPSHISNAATEWDNMIGKAEPSKETITSMEGGASGVVSIVKKLLEFLQVASGLTTILIVAFTGFNYILTTDAEVKGTMKKKALPVIIGFICVFSASSIASFLIGVTGK